MNGQLFYAAPFAVDGEFFGVAQWDIADLSPRWLEACHVLLRNREPNFTSPLPPPLQSVELRFTSARGAALATYSSTGVPFASSALLRGEDAAAEQQLLSLFVHSARGLHIVRASQKTPEPFAEIFAVAERPLHAVIVFGSADHGEAAAEFSTHLAAAFFHCHRA